MKVVGLMEHGGPEVLKVYETEDVHAGPGQIRIANKAAAVSPTAVSYTHLTLPTSQYV